MKGFLSGAFAAIALCAGSAIAGLDSYEGDYFGTLDVKTGKKNRAIVADAFVFSSEPDEPAEFYISAFGSRGQEVEIEIYLNPDGTGSLLVEGMVAPEPKFLDKPKGGKKPPKVKKVPVKIRASGRYTIGTDGVTISFAFSGNSGKAGNNVTGTLALDPSGGLVVALSTGFKQSVKGLGRRVVIGFNGARLDDGFDDEFDEDE